MIGTSQRLLFRRKIIEPGYALTSCRVRLWRRSWSGSSLSTTHHDLIRTLPAQVRQRRARMTNTLLASVDFNNDGRIDGATDYLHVEGRQYPGDGCDRGLLYPAQRSTVGWLQPHRICWMYSPLDRTTRLDSLPGGSQIVEFFSAGNDPVAPGLRSYDRSWRYPDSGIRCQRCADRIELSSAA